ncbi:MAG: excinuclease ABC subunit UvrA, partial [Acidobacteria bacterium]|nr:excinuclease ABC subunit UvrA [Acidobacteriota bacterium]
CRAVEGRENAGEVVLVNQAPIGRTPKSNPATYSKAFTGIRRHFASLPAARRAGYRPGYFSFNVPGGRCGTCEGSGHEKVEMQFLADVYVRCQDCDGRRFGPEVLQILDRGRSIADVLRMTVEEAIRFFGISSPISRTLGPLRAVGLGYLRLGQPMNTMAGGEAQRLKLARRLDPEKKGDCLFLLDEPTTGLHFEDIRRLLAAIDSLLKAGHSVVVIEHNLDVIKMADHVIDLGPEGGEEGGRIVAVGPPEAIAANLDSHTGRFLRTVLRPAGRISPPAEVPRRPGGEEDGEVIRIRGAREHNLKNLEVRIPRERFIVLTGLSGSGKSTLAFDILYSEGQRRYLESLTAYARQFLKPLHRPDIDGLDGVPPVIAIEQRTSRGGKKSTVATLTEIYPYLRLLFAKLGTQHCPACALPIGAWTSRRIVGDIERVFYGKAVRIFAPVVMGRKGFHREIFARIQKERFPRVRVDGRVVRSDPAPSLDRYREHDIEILIDTVRVTKVHGSRLRESLKSGLRLGNRAVLVGPVGTAERLYSLTRMCPRCGIGFPELDPRLFSFHHRQGICSGCRGSGVDENADLRACPECRGARLRPEALAVRFRGRGIADIAALPVEGAKRFFQAIEFTPRESMVGGEIVQEIENRLDFLEEVGLAYLGLDRPAPTLSGGEAQRLRLAAQLGSNLRGVCYILDEPTIGLHPSDNDKLLKTLRRLKKRGNTILVVEHDEATIRAADHIIDLGPGGGLEGGEIVAQGELSAILNNPASITGVWLREGAGRNGLRASRVGRGHKMLRILGARHNNLRGIDVGIPLRALTCVTGVSGSGKSSLVQEILYRALQKKLTGEGAVPGRHRRLLGWRDLDRVVEVDQSPIGRTSRSVPASYIGFLGPIRALFALVPEARARGFTPSRFSFNVPGGRCEACAGQGKTRIVMNFLPDCFVDCDACGGSRFHDDTLEILYRGKTIAGILGMTVREASSFFSVVPRVRNLVAMLEEIGLGYLRLGQPSNTLSGGEAQRIKLVAELGQSRDGRTLYILDEPTTGLHPADIDKLLGILHRLIDRGDTVIVIEHNLEVIRHADFVVDLGPGAGEEGGRLLAAAPPAALLKVKNSRTAQYLRRHLDRFRPSVKLATG